MKWIIKIIDEYSYHLININLCRAFTKQRKIQIYHENGTNMDTEVQLYSWKTWNTV